MWMIASTRTSSTRRSRGSLLALLLLFLLQGCIFRSAGRGEEVRRRRCGGECARRTSAGLWWRGVCCTVLMSVADVLVIARLWSIAFLMAGVWNSSVEKLSCINEEPSPTEEDNLEASKITICLISGPRDVRKPRGGRSSGLVARREPDLDNLEPLDEGLNKKKEKRREERNGGTAESHCSMHDRNEEQDSTKNGLDCSKTIPFKAFFCPCGRYLGGELAYDTNSRLRVPNVNPPKSSTAVTQGQYGSRSHEILQETVNSMHVLDRDVVDGGAARGDMDDPPLVMECGQVCSCSCLCKYRVSQNGLAVKAKVVRTSFKGWGLSAKQAISKASFVCEYAGELITTGKARERQNFYDTEKHGKHWQGSALLTVREHLPSGRASVRVNVDATRTGNVARFINHSCDGGNLVPCLIRTAGCVIPKLALFARRAISDGEELSYSYGTPDINAEPWKPCFCGTPACIGRLPSECT